MGRIVTFLLVMSLLAPLVPLQAGSGDGHDCCPLGRAGGGECCKSTSHSTSAGATCGKDLSNNSICKISSCDSGSPNPLLMSPKAILDPLLGTSYPEFGGVRTIGRLRLPGKPYFQPPQPPPQLPA